MRVFLQQLSVCWVSLSMVSCPLVELKELKGWFFILCVGSYQNENRVHRSEYHYLELILAAP
jgi:hypothetical protein